MWLPLASAKKASVAIGWSLRGHEGSAFTAYHAFDDDSQRRQILKPYKTTARGGTLLLRREGDAICFLAAEEPSNTFVELRRDPVGREDANMVRVAIQKRGTQGAFRVRVTDFSVKTGEPLPPAVAQ
jgi:hypothetical protein